MEPLSNATDRVHSNYSENVPSQWNFIHRKPQIPHGSSLVPNPSLRYEKEVANSLSHCTGPRELKFAISENVRTSNVYWTLQHRYIWGMKNQPDVTCYLFHLLCAQHVSDINISIFRSLRLCWWVTTSVVFFSVRCVLEFLLRLKLQHTTNWEQDDRCGNSSTQSQAPEDGYINVRNMLSP